MLDSLILKILQLRDRASFGIKDKIFFFRELSYMIEGGISIVDAIKTIGSSSSNFALKTVCREINESLNKGVSLSRVLTRMTKYFNEGDVNIIKSGESSGELPKVLLYLAEEYEFLYNIKNKYVSAMMYPSIIFIVSIVALIILFTTVLPSIFSLLQDFSNVKIPYTTQLLMNLTDFIGGNVKQIIVTILLFIMFIGVLFSIEDGKKFLHSKLFSVPVIGQLSRYYYLIKFLRYMKLLLAAGMNYLEIFMFLEKIMGHESYKQIIRQTIAGVKRGEKLVTHLEDNGGIIPNDVIILLKVGEETASFDKSISNAVSLYDQEFNKMLDNLSKVVEPFLMIFVGGVVGFIALSVFGMIGNILGSVNGG